MDNDMFNIHTPIVDRDLGVMTMGFTQMPYMGAGFMSPYMCTNYLNGTKIFDQPPKDTFESYKEREKKDNLKMMKIPLIIAGILCAKPIFKGLGKLAGLFKKSRPAPTP